MTRHMPVTAVTGASGFVGEALVNRLVGEGKVRALVRRLDDRSAGLAEGGCEIVIGDLDNERALATLTGGAEVVYHCAATLAKTDPTLSQRVNVAGTERVARAARAAGARRFVYVSSISVYAATRRESDTLTEEVEPENIARLNNYSRTKYEGELAVRRVAREESLPYTIIRPTNIYGLRSRPWFRQWARLLDLVPVAIGDVAIDVVYVDDVVDAMVTAADSPAARDEVFNIGHEMVKMNAFIVEIGRVAGHRARVLPRPVDRAVCVAAERLFTLLTGTTLSPSLTRPVFFPHDKARRLLGYEPRFGLAEGFAQLGRRYRREA